MLVVGAFGLSIYSGTISIGARNTASKGNKVSRIRLGAYGFVILGFSHPADTSPAYLNPTLWITGALKSSSVCAGIRLYPTTVSGCDVWLCSVVWMVRLMARKRIRNPERNLPALVPLSL